MNPSGFSPNWLAHCLVVGACGVGYSVHSWRVLSRKGGIRYSIRALLLFAWFSALSILTAIAFIPAAHPWFRIGVVFSQVPWMMALALYRFRGRCPGSMIDLEDVAVGGALGLIVSGGCLASAFLFCLDHDRLSGVPFAMVWAIPLFWVVTGAESNLNHAAKNSATGVAPEFQGDTTKPGAPSPSTADPPEKGSPPEA